MINNRQLRDELVLTFTENELKTLAAQVEIPYQSLRGKTQADRFSVLIGRLERLGRVPDLVLALVTANPNYKDKYAVYLEQSLPGKLDESVTNILLDISKGSAPMIEEPPTVRWETQINQKKDESE